MNKLMLSHLHENALPKLQDKINHALSLGYFAQKFKTAVLKLIPKPAADHINHANYRSISPLEVTGKVLEKIINKRLRNYFNYRHQNTDSEARDGLIRHLALYM